jgi:hypothetical protein
MRQALAWLAVGALVVLGARSIVYALSPSPLAAELSHQAGGPGLPAIALVSVSLALALSTAVVWLTALGVRERRLVETRPMIADSRLRLGLVPARALALWLVSMPAFALLESYIHWRQGLGWHGLHCLTGPVHRDAIPILGAFSLVAASLATALEHVFAWMRRTLASLAGRPGGAGLVPIAQPPAGEAPLAGVLGAALGARGPPRLS